MNKASMVQEDPGPNADFPPCQGLVYQQKDKALSKHIRPGLGPAFVPVLAQGRPRWHPVRPGFGSGWGPGGTPFVPVLAQGGLRWHPVRPRFGLGGPVGTPLVPLLAQWGPPLAPCSGFGLGWGSPLAPRLSRF